LKIENYKCYSVNKLEKFKPENFVKARLQRVEYTLKIFKSIKPEDLNIYISDLKNKLSEIVGDYEFNTEVFDWDLIREDLVILKNFPDLERLIFLYSCKTVKLPEDYVKEQEEIKLPYFDIRKTAERISYYLVKSLADIYGKEEGTKIYKKIAPLLLKEYRAKIKSDEPEDPKSVTVHDSNKRSIESWCRVGLADFTSCVLDDYKVIYRFDICQTPEALKEFNDPDIAYLSSCYLADIPEFNKGRTIHLRRTQTLHHAKFCDEFYWNNHVHPNAEQPDLKFTENMGKNL
jgi:hypothetical protein